MCYAGTSDTMFRMSLGGVPCRFRWLWGEF
jgi:hypothetical protein